MKNILKRTFVVATSVIFAASMAHSVAIASTLDTAAPEGDLGSVASSSELVNFYGKSIDVGVAYELEEYAEREGINLKVELFPQMVKASNRGGVNVPAGYVYNPSLGARHDYCTKSPDQFPAPGDNADFSGACARHDMCMDRVDARGGGYLGCNNTLYSDMTKVCNATYTNSWDPRRGSCLNTARTYWLAVTGSHLDAL